MGIDSIRNMVLRTHFGLIYKKHKGHLIVLAPKGVFYAKFKVREFEKLLNENDLSHTLTYNNIFNWTL